MPSRRIRRTIPAHPPTTPAASWELIDKNLAQLESLIQAGKIGNLGSSAYGTANAFQALAGQSASLPADKLAEVQRDVKIVGMTAGISLQPTGCCVTGASERGMRITSMKKPKKWINHVVFNVEDLDRAVKFYTDVVGMKLIRRFDDRKMAFVSFGEHHHDIGLFQVGGTPEHDRQWHGFNHLAMEYDGGPEILDQLHKRLIETDREKREA